MQPLTPARLLHVIANQCTHWCGNPFSPQGNLATWHCLGRIRDALRIRPKCYFLLCTTARRTDCHVAALLAMTVGDVLATADTCPSSACHCEPVHGGPRKGAPFAGRGATRERCPAPAFGRSRAWRTLGRRGVAIRSPRRETWQLGNTLGEFAPTLPGCHCEPVRTPVAIRSPRRETKK